MRNAILLLTMLLQSLSAAASRNEIFSPFYQPLLEDVFNPDNATLPELELLKRQTNGGCASGYNSCSYLGAAGLCCQNTAICAQDNAGHVACCPQGAYCTGTIGTVVGATATSFQTGSSQTLTTTTAGGQTVTVGAGGTVSATTSNGLVVVTAGAGGTTSAGARSYPPVLTLTLPANPISRLALLILVVGLGQRVLL